MPFRLRGIDREETDRVVEEPDLLVDRLMVHVSNNHFRYMFFATKICIFNAFNMNHLLINLQDRTEQL